MLDALAAGAAAVQIYTAFVMQGPGMVHRINKELVQFLDAQGCESLEELLKQPAEQWHPSRQ